MSTDDYEDFERARLMASGHGCFATIKRDAKGFFFLLFRRVNGRKIFIGKRRNVKAFKYFVGRCCG
jgi:hypothetical protein